MLLDTGSTAGPLEHAEPICSNNLNKSHGGSTCPLSRRQGPWFAHSGRLGTWQAGAGQRRKHPRQRRRAARATGNLPPR